MGTWTTYTYISTAILSYEWFMWGSFRLAPIRLIFLMYLGCSASYLEVTIVPGTLFCNFGSNYVLRVLIFFYLYAEMVKGQQCLMHYRLLLAGTKFWAFGPIRKNIKQYPQNFSHLKVGRKFSSTFILQWLVSLLIGLWLPGCTNQNVSVYRYRQHWVVFLKMWWTKILDCLLAS